ncbi:MAG: DUF2779 domain-containing protein [Bacilli bacterium]
MVITKTDFINYIRCRRYTALEEVRKNKKDNNITIEEYKAQEKSEDIKEIVGMMFDSDDNDLTFKEDKQLNAMMKYYKKAELLAGRESERLFKGNFIYSKDTYSQESFDFVSGHFRYLCYVDIYNEEDDHINIIEVKATTSSKFKKLLYGKKDDKKELFIKKNGIYVLNNQDTFDKTYDNQINKLKNRFSDVGKYVYDLAVQRFFIESSFKEVNVNKKINYYLCVLNSDYIYDGVSDYEIDENGEKIVEFYDMNSITNDLMPVVLNDKKLLESYIEEDNSSVCNTSVSCALKTNHECKFSSICFKDVPKKNSSFSYKQFVSFKDENGVKYNKYDLVNNGILKFDDVPYNWLSTVTHIIQRNAYDNNTPYIDKNKIKAGLKSFSFPIYHFDFETFPCPLPRFKGEKCYTQSPFEFSLHIEREEGVCDKNNDNIVYLAKSNNDERLDLIHAMIDSIDLSNGGTVLAQNVNFEKMVTKELARIFPEYKDKLMNIYDHARDLLEVILNNKELYLSLGFSEEESSKVNYYNKDQSGSYSIKKTLPLFSDLKYSDLEIQNGVEALVEYSKFHEMGEMEKEKTRENLRVYCQQDTWAMVEILRGLRKLIM